MKEKGIIELLEACQSLIDDNVDCIYIYQVICLSIIEAFFLRKKLTN